MTVEIVERLLRLLKDDPSGWDHGATRHTWHHAGSQSTIWIGNGMLQCGPYRPEFRIGLWDRRRLWRAVDRAKREKTQRRLNAYFEEREKCAPGS